MNCSFLEQAWIAAVGRDFVQRVLFFFQNTEIEFVALAIVKTFDNVALLTRNLKPRVRLRRCGSGLAKLFRALVATRFEHHASVLVLKHVTRRKTLRHCAAPIRQVVGEIAFGFGKRGFGGDAGTELARIILQRFTRRARANGLNRFQ
jgi:hypothetical protein